MRSVLLGLAAVFLAGCMGRSEMSSASSDLTATECAASCWDALRSGGYPCSDGEDEHADLMACACAPDACADVCGETLCRAEAAPQFNDNGNLTPCEFCLHSKCVEPYLPCRPAQP